MVAACRTVALAVLLLAGVARGQETAPPCQSTPCSLQETIAATVAGHPLMDMARADLASFEAKVRATKLAWIPSIKSRTLFSGTPSKWGDPVYGGTDYGLENWGPVVRFEVSGQMPIYSFGRLGLLKEMAAAGLNAGQAKVQMARSQLELLVVQAYFGMQLADELEDLLGEGEKYLTRAREYLEQLRDEDSEDYDDVDMLRLRVTESEVGTYRLDAARTARLALSGLTKLTGLPESALTPAPKLRPLKADLDSLEDYLTLAYRERGEMKTLESALLAQGLQIKYEKRGFLPVFFLAGYFTYGRAWAVEEQKSPFAYDPYNSWFSGVAAGIQYKLNTPYQVLALDEARAKHRKLKAQHETLAQKVALEVEQAFLEVTDLKAKLKMTKRAYKAARGWTIAKLDLYESGLEPFKDMADALTAFFKQRMAFAQARYDYNVGLAKLAHACGVPLSRLLKDE